MDIKLEKKKGWRALFQKKNLPYAFAGAFVIFVAWLLLRDNASVLRVDADVVTVSEVRGGEFNDYVRLTGTVQPITTVQLSPLESGIVERIVAEEGASVKRGDVIIEMSNNSLSMQILQSEADLAEKQNILRNTLISMEQERLSLRQNRLQLDLDVERKRRAYLQNEELYKSDLLAKEDWLRSKEDYELSKSQRVDNLKVKAPIDGEVGMLDVVLGRSIAQGANIGQINDLSTFKVTAQIDEHYIDRVVTGLTASFERQDTRFEMLLRKVYPEVRNGQFRADFVFAGDVPENIRSGQTYYLNLQLGQPTEAIIIPRGSFYQSTGGAWIYVVDASGEKAYRRDIRIGRQNPQYYEVTEGLQAGEKVITSSYDNFGDHDVLLLKH